MGSGGQDPQQEAAGMRLMTNPEALELLWQVFEVDPDSDDEHTVIATIYGKDMADCRDEVTEYFSGFAPEIDPETVSYAPDTIDEDPMTTATTITIRVAR
jgi:hypothetical protein